MSQHRTFGRVARTGGQRRRPFRDAEPGSVAGNPTARPERRVTIPSNVTDDATPKQLRLIDDLMHEVELTDEQREAANVALDGGLGKQQASRWIERLLELKHTSHPPTRDVNRGPGVPLRDDVPAGRYAVTGDDGTTDFYKVDRPDSGKWEGYVFVKLLVAQGGHGLDQLREQRLGFEQTRTILDRIAADGIEEASARFGKSIGHCGVCGRELTKDESIARGIGPVCAGRMGWS